MKNKNTKKNINYYKVNSNLHVPYKLLVDGNFFKKCHD